MLSASRVTNHGRNHTSRGVNPFFSSIHSIAIMAGSLILQALESLSTGRVIASILLFFFGAFIADFTWKPRYPKSLPRVGYGAGVLGTMRNWLGYVMYFNDWVAEGYEQVRTTDFLTMALPD
jgi:hypothetical protein